MYWKLRVWVPSPQISISRRPLSFRFDYLPADRRRRLLAASLPGATVDVVIPSDSRRQAEISKEMVAHASGEELLPTVAILRHCRIGVLLPQRLYISRLLLVRGVHAGRRGVEISLDVRLAGGKKHVRVDQARQHSKSFIVFDEAHSPPVAGEVPNHFGICARGSTLWKLPEVQNAIVGLIEALEPVSGGFDIDGPHRLTGGQ